jgi:EthD domain-containing protein
LEKVIYLLWRDPGQPLEAWCRKIRGELADSLVALGARSLQVNVFDEIAAPGVEHIQGGGPLIEGFVQLWLDSANDAPRAAFDAAIAANVLRMAAYLVSESILQTELPRPAALGQRTPCFAQMAMFRCLPSLTREQWWDIWRNSHSRIAPVTQASFYYAQHLTVRPLTPNAPLYDAIVEECFPDAALTSQHAFFGAADDTELELKRGTCMRSIARFVDFTTIAVVPTSQYLIR